MNKQNAILPSIQVMELMGGCGSYDTADVLMWAAEFQFYRAAETAALENAEEAARTLRVCRDANMRWTCWATPFIIGEKLNLSSVNESERLRAVARLTDVMKMAADSGADAFAVLSGAVPETPVQLPDAIKAAAESLSQLAAAAAKYPELSLLIEPLDRDVHKRNTIGPTSDAVSVIQEARKANPRVYMAWDSAHMALMREDLVTSLSIAGGTIGQLHLCNAVLDPKNPLYGDYHMKPGRPGYLTILRAADTIAEAVKCGIEVEALPVAIEVRPSKGEKPLAVEAEARAFLAEAIKVYSNSIK